MEVFIRDEETKWDISYSLADSNNSLDCKDHKPIIVKSLEQHDAEVRQQVIAELEEWIKKYSKVEEWDNVYNVTRTYLYKEDLQQKLTEMKGTKFDNKVGD